MNIIPETEQMTTKDMKRTGDGGDSRVCTIREDQYMVVKNDSNLITDRDRRLNKINQEDGKSMVHPTLGECIERIVEIYINLPEQYKKMKIR